MIAVGAALGCHSRGVAEGTACPPHGDTGTSLREPPGSCSLAHSPCSPPSSAPAPAHSFVLSRCNPTPRCFWGGGVGDPPAASRQWGKPKLPKLRARRVWKMGWQRGGGGRCVPCAPCQGALGTGAGFGGSWHSLSCLQPAQSCSVAHSIPWLCPAWSLQVSVLFPEKSGRGSTTPPPPSKPQ